MQSENKKHQIFISLKNSHKSPACQFSDADVYGNEATFFSKANMGPIMNTLSPTISFLLIPFPVTLQLPVLPLVPAPLESYRIRGSMTPEPDSGAKLTVIEKKFKHIHYFVQTFMGNVEISTFIETGKAFSNKKEPGNLYPQLTGIVINEKLRQSMLPIKLMTMKLQID